METVGYISGQGITSLGKMQIMHIKIPTDVIQ